MSNHWKWVWLGAIALAGCYPPRFPRELFVLGADGADYPVMLSKVPSAKAGRVIEASSGTRAVVNQSSASAGSTTVTVTHAHYSESELSAWAKLSVQLQRSDTWVQLDGASFVSWDIVMYGGSAAADRTLMLRAQAHR